MGVISFGLDIFVVSESFDLSVGDKDRNLGHEFKNKHPFSFFGFSGYIITRNKNLVACTLLSHNLLAHEVIK